MHFDQWNPPNFKNLIIENIPPINRQESNMKITLLIKSGYNIVPNLSTTLMYQLNLSLLQISITTPNSFSH